MHHSKKVSKRCLNVGHRFFIEIDANNNLTSVPLAPRCRPDMPYAARTFQVRDGHPLIYFYRLDYTHPVRHGNLRQIQIHRISPFCRGMEKSVGGSSDGATGGGFFIE